MFLLRKARLLLAFFATLLMWVFHDRLWLMLRHRYFARLFTADCLLYRKIKSSGDTNILQKDLDALQQWESTWLMQFNPDIISVRSWGLRIKGNQNMSQVDSHCCKASRSFCKILVSSELLIFRYSRQSSANNRAVAVGHIFFEWNKCLWSEVVNRRRTDNTMANGKKTKGQTICKTLHRKQKIF
jgi:hypothetical protein